MLHIAVEIFKKVVKESKERINKTPRCGNICELLVKFPSGSSPVPTSYK